MKSTYVRGAVLAVLAGIMWAFSGVCGQFLFNYRGFDTFWLTSTRMLIAGGLMLIHGFIRYGKGMFDVWKDRQSVIDIIIYAIVCMAGVQLTYFGAIQLSNAATATILQYTGVAMVVIWVAFRAKRLPYKIEMVAVLTASMGVFIMSTHGDIHNLVFSKWALIIALISAVCMASYTIQPKRLLARYGTAKVNAWGICLGGLIVMSIRRPWELGGGNLDLAAIGATSGVIICGTILAFFFYMEALRLIGSTHTVLYALSEPLFSAVFTILAFKISFGVIDWAGALLIISTTVIISKAPREEGANVKEKSGQEELTDNSAADAGTDTEINDKP